MNIYKVKSKKAKGKTSLRLCGLFFLLTAYCLLPTVAGQTRDFTRWVNPFIGTGGHGHTFPGATMPFGMVQLSPDTRNDNWDGSSGYHYSDDIIYGFSHTHLSGTGIPDGCDILFMPETDIKDGTYSHSDEVAEPGYYSVRMKNGIVAELTATRRVGVHRYSFPDTKSVHLILSLNWRDEVLDSELRISGKNQIEGFRRSSSWAKDQIVYFVAEFSQPFASHGIAYNDVLTEQGEWIRDAKGTNLTGLFHFKNPGSRKILVKVAISYVSIEGARKNLAAEVPGWDFDKVRADAKATWNKELSKIEVSGGTDAQTTTFYTALYHTMIHPSIFNDVDGSYRGLDGKIHQLPGYAAVPLASGEALLRRKPPISPAAPPPIERRHSRTDQGRSGRKSTAFPHSDGQSPNRKSKIENPNREITIQCSHCGTPFARGASALYDHRSKTHGRFYQHIHPTCMSRAGGCLFGNFGAKRPTR